MTRRVILSKTSQGREGGSALESYKELYPPTPPREHIKSIGQVVQMTDPIEPIFDKTRIRWQGYRFFFTFSRCTLTVDQLYSHIDLKKPVARAIFCQEEHRDGFPHVHAAIEFSRPVDTYNNRFFDVGGYHPSWEPVRSWQAACRYVQKDGNLRYFGCSSDDILQTPQAGVGNHREGRTIPDNLSEIASGCADELEWLQRCASMGLAGFYCRRIWDIIGQRKGVTVEENQELRGLYPCDMLSFVLWPTRLDTDHAIVLLGPAGSGKTTWAMVNAPTPFLWVNDINALSSFDANYHKAIVFDECRFTGDPITGKGKYPLTTQICLADLACDRQIRVLYGYAKIPKHTKRIFTCTDWVCFTKDPQIERRIHLINLYSPDKPVWLL